MKAQGSVEYLVIFAAVLVIGLIVLFLLGQFQGFGQKSLIDQSRSYWRGATPIGIREVTFSASGDDVIAFVNNDPEPLNLLNFSSTSPSGVANPTFSIGVLLAPGKSVVVANQSTLSVDCDSSSEVGALVELRDVTITYSKQDLPNAVLKQVGSVPLRGECTS